MKGIEFRSKGGMMHLMFSILFIGLAILFRPIKELFVFYTELEILSWTVFKNECLFSYLHKKEKKSSYLLGENPYLADVVFPEWIHYLGLICRLYLFSTMSSWTNTLALLPLLLFHRIKKGVIYDFFQSPYRFIVIPYLLYLYHGPSGPFPFSNIKPYKNIINFTITVISLYLFYILWRFPRESDLWVPMAVGYFLFRTHLLWYAFYLGYH